MMKFLSLSKLPKMLSSSIVLTLLCGRILDNLPLVVPVQRLVHEAPPLYQLGFHVGLKGQYAGVSYPLKFCGLFLCKFFLLLTAL